MFDDPVNKYAILKIKYKHFNQMIMKNHDQKIPFVNTCKKPN